MPTTALGGLFGGMEAGRETNERRKQSKHRRELDNAQEKRLLDTAKFVVGSQYLGLQNEANPDTIGRIDQLGAGNSLIPHPVAQPGVISRPSSTGDPAQAPATVAPRDAPVPALNDLLGKPGRNVPPAGLSPAANPIRAQSPRESSGAAPPPQAKKRMTAREMGFYTEDARDNYDASRREASQSILDSKVLKAKGELALETINSQRLYGSDFMKNAEATLSKRFGNYDKALEASPSDFFSAIGKIQAEGHSRGMTLDGMNSVGLKSILDAYTTSRAAKLDKIAKNSNASKEERLQLEATSKQVKSMGRYLIEALGGSLEPGMDAMMGGTLEGAQLAAFNTMRSRAMAAVVRGELGELAAMRVAHEYAQQDGAVQFNTDMVPNHPASLKALSDMGIVVAGPGVKVRVDKGVYYLSTDGGKTWGTPPGLVGLGLDKKASK